MTNIFNSNYMDIILEFVIYLNGINIKQIKNDEVLILIKEKLSNINDLNFNKDKELMQFILNLKYNINDILYSNNIDNKDYCSFNFYSKMDNNYFSYISNNNHIIEAERDDNLLLFFNNLIKIKEKLNMSQINFDKNCAVTASNFNRYYDNILSIFYIKLMKIYFLLFDNNTNKLNIDTEIRELKNNMNLILSDLDFSKIIINDDYNIKLLLKRINNVTNEINKSKSMTSFSFDLNQYIDKINADLQKINLTQKNNKNNKLYNSSIKNISVKEYSSNNKKYDSNILNNYATPNSYYDLVKEENYNSGQNCDNKYITTSVNSIKENRINNVENYNSFEFLKNSNPNFNKKLSVNSNDYKNILDHNDTEIIEQTEKKNEALNKENIYDNIKISFGPQPDNYANNNIDYSSKTVKDTKTKVNADQLISYNSINDDDNINDQLAYILNKYSSNNGNFRLNNSDCIITNITKKEIDVEFPPYISNIFNNSNNYSLGNFDKFEWRRISSLFCNIEYNIKLSPISYNLIKFGRYTNICLLLLISKNSNYINDIFKIVNYDKNKEIFEIKFKNNNMILDDFIPILNIYNKDECSLHKQLFEVPFIQPNIIDNNMSVYYLLLEKLLAKISNSYFKYKTNNHNILSIIYDNMEVIEMTENNINNFKSNKSTYILTYKNNKAKFYYLSNIDYNKKEINYEKINKKTNYIELIQKSKPFEIFLNNNSYFYIYTNK